MHQNPHEIKKRKRFIIHVKSVLTKLARDLQIDPCDLSYVVKRLHSEGLAFVTKILPAFSKYSLTCCEMQRVVDCRSLGFTYMAVQGRSPRFMRGLLQKAVDGSACALLSIRQFCEYFYKTAFDFEKIETKAALAKYLRVDMEYEKEKIDWKKVNQVRKTLESGFPDLNRLVPSDLYRIVRPHDGPGAFAGSSVNRFAVRESGQLIVKSCNWAEYKKLPSYITGTCLRSHVPFGGYFKPYPAAKERIKPFPALDETCYTAELRFVPKDSRGPRTISKEPMLLLRAQMAAGKTIAKVLETDTSFRINFADQTVNQELARISSMTRENATLDLQDASDRNWLSVCRALYRNIPALRHAISLRSTHVSYPSTYV